MSVMEKQCDSDKEESLRCLNKASDKRKITLQPARVSPKAQNKENDTRNVASFPSHWMGT